MAKERNAGRQEILATLAQVGREHSDATVLFHARLASLLDLHPTDYKTLSVLQRLGPLTAGDIAVHTGLAAASVTSLIDRLERKGFARRVSDARDHRRVVVEVRDEPVNAARQSLRSPSESLARLFERYSDAELRVIADFLARNAARLRAETVNLRSPRSRAHMRTQAKQTRTP